jgi:hypothetical protein
VVTILASWPEAVDPVEVAAQAALVAAICDALGAN